MQILLKSATIVDRSSSHNGKKRDILISEGQIIQIAASIASSADMQVVDLPNLHVSQGWFDSSVSFGEPGYEERETIANGMNVAARAGFTHVAINANSYPVIDNKSQIDFIKTKAANHAVSAYPVGALTNGSKGESLAELYDMKVTGASSFYDYKQPVNNVNLLKIALQYTQPFDGLVQSFPLEKGVAAKGVMHEDGISTSLGLKGIPSLAEYLQVNRDLAILEYTGGKLHIPTISTKESVAMIAKAKEAGLDVSCSVAGHNLVLNHDCLTNFDTRYKVLPPLRHPEDVRALIQGLKDGVIDGITTDHNPLDIELKKKEFDHAEFGSIGLESGFGAVQQALGLETTVNGFTGLKARFGIAIHPIEENNLADLSLFNPESSYTFTEQNIDSSSKNAIFLNSTLNGKAYGIYANGKMVLNHGA